MATGPHEGDATEDSEPAEGQELQPTTEAEIQLQRDGLKVRMAGPVAPERLWRLALTAFLLISGVVGTAVVMVFGELWQAGVLLLLCAGALWVVWRLSRRA